MLRAMAVQRVVIDTDAGVDDALALLLALRSPELKVEAITAVHGNVGVERAVRNIRLVLHLLGLGGSELPRLAQGQALPLLQRPREARQVHGDDGLGGVSHLARPDGSLAYPEAVVPLDPAPAPLVLLDLVRRYPDEVTLITLGPLTNIATALLLDRSALAALRRVVVMGGALGGGGNTTAVAEFNIWSDPEAARIVFSAGLPLTMVGLDVTQQVVLTRSLLLECLTPKGTGVSQFVADCTGAYMAYHRRHHGMDGCFLHDPLAVGVAIQPAFVRTAAVSVQVETRGEWTRGMTVRADPSDPDSLPAVQAAVAVESQAFLEFFCQRLG